MYSKPHHVRSLGVQAACISPVRQISCATTAASHQGRSTLEPTANVACRYARPAAGEGMWPQAATQTEKGSCSSSKHGDVVPGQLQSATGDSDRPDLTCWGRATAAVVLMRERQPRIDQLVSQPVTLASSITEMASGIRGVELHHGSQLIGYLHPCQAHLLGPLMASGAVVLAGVLSSPPGSREPRLVIDLFLFSPSSPQGVPAIDQPHILDQLKGTLIHVRPLPATMTTLQPQASLAEAATPQLQPTTTAVSGTDGPNTLIRFPASCTSSSHLDIPSFPESTRSSVQGCPCCGGTQVHLAAPHYTYDTFPRWGPPLAAASLEDEAADLLGPWASVPISDDYTFGIEIEFAFHGVRTEEGVCFAHSTDSQGTVTGWRVRESVSKYLTQMGVSEEWRVKEDGSIQMTSGVSSALTALMWQSCIQAELISPILRGQEGLVEVARVLAVLNTLPIEVNASTGLHVHVAPYRDPPFSDNPMNLTGSHWSSHHVMALAHLFQELQPAMDQLVPKERREGSNKSATELEVPEHEWPPLLEVDEAKLEGLARTLRHNVRTRKLNVHALEKHGTIEFRHPRSSTCIDEVCGFIALYLRLAEISHTTAWTCPVHSSVIQESPLRQGVTHALIAGLCMWTALTVHQACHAVVPDGSHIQQQLPAVPEPSVAALDHLAHRLYMAAHRLCEEAAMSAAWPENNSVLQDQTTQIVSDLWQLAMALDCPTHQSHMSPADHVFRLTEVVISPAAAARSCESLAEISMGGYAQQRQRADGDAFVFISALRSSQLPPNTSLHPALQHSDGLDLVTSILNPKGSFKKPRFSGTRQGDQHREFLHRSVRHQPPTPCSILRAFPPAPPDPADWGSFFPYASPVSPQLSEHRLRQAEQLSGLAKPAVATYPASCSISPHIYGHQPRQEGADGPPGGFESAAATARAGRRGQQLSQGNGLSGVDAAAARTDSKASHCKGAAAGNGDKLDITETPGSQGQQLPQPPAAGASAEEVAAYVSEVQARLGPFFYALAPVAAAISQRPEPWADPELHILSPEQRRSVASLARCLGGQPHLIGWMQRQVLKAAAGSVGFNAAADHVKWEMQVDKYTSIKFALTGL